MNEKTRKAMTSSKSSEWSTPEDLFAQLDREFGFCLDAAANERNRKCDLYISEREDALKTDWNEACLGRRGAIWCNPPYGRDLGAWLEKGYEASLKGRTVVFLLPARTDTRWFHEFAPERMPDSPNVQPPVEERHPADEIRFIKGRLTFGGAPAPAVFPSVLFIFRPPNQGPYRWSVMR